MFKENKYTNTYYNLISTAAEKDRSKSENYYESHHIIPRSLGGSNEKSNLVLLTPREHYIAHLLLTKMCEGNFKYKMIWALHVLTFAKDQKLYSRSYDLVRRLHAKNMKFNHPSYNPDSDWSDKVSRSTKEIWAKSPKRRILVGKVFSDSHKDRQINDPEYYKKQRQNALSGASAVKKRWSEDEEWSAEQKIKMSNRTSGKNNPMYGRKIEGEHLEKLRKASKNKRWVNNGVKENFVNSELLTEYINLGFSLGRLKPLRKKGGVVNESSNH